MKSEAKTSSVAYIQRWSLRAKDSLMTWKSCFSYDQQDVGLASADCITAATPAVSKATVLAKPVNNTRHADMVLVL